MLLLPGENAHVLPGVKADSPPDKNAHVLPDEATPVPHARPVAPAVDFGAGGRICRRRVLSPEPTSTY